MVLARPYEKSRPGQQPFAWNCVREVRMNEQEALELQEKLAHYRRLKTQITEHQFELPGK